MFQLLLKQKAVSFARAHTHSLPNSPLDLEGKTPEAVSKGMKQGGLPFRIVLKSN